MKNSETIVKQEAAGAVSFAYTEEKTMVNTLDFNKEIARDYGLRESVIATYLWELLEKDMESIERHGRIWTRISQRMITVALPFMSVDMARRSLKKLAEEGIIMRAEFNDDKFDRTHWYTFTDYGYEMMDPGTYS